MKVPRLMHNNALLIVCIVAAQLLAFQQLSFMKICDVWKDEKRVQDEPTITTSRRKTFDLDPAHALDIVNERYWTSEMIRDRNPDGDLIYFITPTHKHIGQWMDFVRLSQTLMHYRPNIYWVVIEDSQNCTRRLREWLDYTGLMYAHLHEASPVNNAQKHRGVNQRNRALDHIDSLKRSGVVYFGDSDNAYNILLFDELLKTKRVSVFGVGFAGKKSYERCHVNNITGKVDFIHGWGYWKRKYPMDMAGFAFHTSILHERQPRFQHNWTKGFLESDFLGLLINDVGDLEPLCNNCTSIYTWHVKTDSVFEGEPYLNDTEYEDLKNLV